MNFRFYHFMLMLVLPYCIQGCTTNQNLSCVYVPHESKENPYPELTQFKNCGYIDEYGVLIIVPEHLNQIWFNKNGLAVVRIYDGIYYVNKQGKTARTHLFDNTADYFSEGLARTIKNNKFGFINKKLDIVIQPAYDFAFPFRDGLSEVCIGCTRKLDGEHIDVVGGKWGYIDRNGRVVEEIIHEKGKLESIKSGK